MSWVNPSSLNYYYGDSKPKYLRRSKKNEDKERIKVRQCLLVVAMTKWQGLGCSNSSGSRNPLCPCTSSE